MTSQLLPRSFLVIVDSIPTYTTTYSDEPLRVCRRLVQSQTRLVVSSTFCAVIYADSQFFPRYACDVLGGDEFRAQCTIVSTSHHIKRRVREAAAFQPCQSISHHHHNLRQALHGRCFEFSTCGSGFQAVSFHSVTLSPQYVSSPSIRARAD